MTNIKIGQKQGCYREVLFSISLEEMEKYLNGASNKLSQGMNIKGFREGKIPRKVVEKSVGSEKIWSEASKQAMEDNYWQTMEKEKIKPIGIPKMEISKLVPGNNFEFKALVPVMPNLELPDYKSTVKKIIEKEHRTITVDAEEIKQSLEWLRRSRAKTSGKNNKEPELPEINDEFAKSLGNFENLDDLKNNLKKSLVKEKENHEKQRVRLLIIEEIISKINLDIPDFMIQQEIDRMQGDLERQVTSMDMTLEDYFKKANKSVEEVREGWKGKARERVSAGIILKAIAEKENIEPTEGEIEEEANKYLRQLKDTENPKAQINLGHIKAHLRGILRNEKVFEFLENARND